MKCVMNCNREAGYKDTKTDEVLCATCGLTNMHIYQNRREQTKMEDL